MGRHRPARPQPLDGVVENGVHRGHHEQGQQGGRDEAADDRAGHRGALLRALAKGECQREHAENHGHGRHDDRAQADAPRLENGVQSRLAGGAPLVHEIDEEDAVLGDEPHEHDDADHRHHVERSPGHEERQCHAEEAEGQGEHDGQRLDKRAEQ